ncbi:MAG: class I SAM-dependent rRNA methyltransferase [Chitinivibrionales bacterium]|nr:class I SAM-dependent rRNA methyltransferase [Chitinivibrionales bacterium]
MINVILKKDRDKPIRMGHPWVFSGAIEQVEGVGKPEPGEQCRVLTNKKEFLGVGYYNEKSTIRVRMFQAQDKPIDLTEIRERIDIALALRQSILNESTNACRLINSEGDFLPGLIVDKYGSGLCLQITTAGMERFRMEIVNCLAAALSPRFIYERAENEAATREGLAAKNSCIHGSLPEKLLIREHGLQFRVDLEGGQKTGFFLDQRHNRLLLRKYAAGATVCDCFAYSGGFSANAWAAGARLVHTVDSSKDALELAKENLAHNKFPREESNFIAADAFEFLRGATTKYSCIILDPPKFARHSADRERASRGYKDINLSAIKIMAPQGILFTFSCSQAIDQTLFSQIVFAAAADSGRQVQVLHRLSQPTDHPFNIAHREGEYLKGLVLRVI